MKKFVKVLLALTLAVMMALPSVTFAEEAETEVTNKTEWLGGENLGMAIDISGNTNSSLACQFVIKSPALRIETCCPTWSRPNGGFLTVSLYAFDTNYEKSIAGKPIAETVFEEFDDNAWLGLDFPETDPLKPGEYVFMLHDGIEGCPSGAWLDKPTDREIFYNDGYVDTEYSLRGKVTFVGDPEEKFGTPTQPEPEATEDPGTEKSDKPYMDFTLMLSDPDLEFIMTAGGGASLEFEDDVLKIFVNAGSDDPQLSFTFEGYGDLPGVPVVEHPIMLIKLRRVNDTDPTVAEIFFYTEDSPGAKAGNNFRFDYENTTDWQYVMIDLSSNRRCRVYFTGFRFDMFDHAPDGGELEVAWVTFFDTKEAAQNFNGDFSPYIVVTPAPTKKPTAEPTAEPTQAPATELPDVTSAPATDVPAKTGDKSGDEKGNKVNPAIFVVIGVVAAAAVAAVIIIAAKKKKEK
jgi:hypothetical protein